MSLILATNPVELAEGQRALIADIDNKIGIATEEARMAERMKDQMIEARLDTSKARSLHRAATERVGYLHRVKAALEAGYCLMPDMPGEIIAVRTDRRTPRSHESAERKGGTWSVPDHRAKRGLPIGEGRYVSPSQICESRTEKVKKKSYDGKSEYEDTETYSKAVALRDPFGVNRRFMRPQIIDKTTGAMMRGIFDEIVCIAPVATSRGRKANDPIVLGRILGPKGVSAFLIAWFVESNEI